MYSPKRLRIALLASVLLSSLFFSGCGGGGGDGDDNTTNHTPQAIDQNITTDEDTAKAITLTGTDEDNDTLTFTITTNPEHGTLVTAVASTLGSSGSAVYTYTPSAGYHGTDSFAFKVNDGFADSDEGHVVITVSPVDDPPILATSSGSVAENATTGTVIGTVTIIDSGDSPIASMTLTGTGSGNFTVDANGQITVARGALLDYETTSEYRLEVYATSAAGVSSSVDVTIDVIDYLAPAQISRILAENGGIEDFFGQTVALDGEYMVVGAPNKSAAYIYRIGTDGNATLLASYHYSGSKRYGAAVAISGDYIAVGAPRMLLGEEDVPTYGRVYVYRRYADDNITLIAQLKANVSIPDGCSNDMFGNRLVMEGSYIVASGYVEPDGDMIQGYVSVFRRVTDANITRIATLNPPETNGHDHFGFSLALDGHHLAIGAHGMGKAYLYDIVSDTGISPLDQFYPSETISSDYFGRAVAIRGNYLVGTSTDVNNRAGAAYLFEIDADGRVHEKTTLVGSDIKNHDAFGASVSMDGARMVIGASKVSVEGKRLAGAAYVFTIDSEGAVTEKAKFNENQPSESAYFGEATAFSGERIAIGGKGDVNATNERVGSVCLFDLEP
jgi:hypothetical protein